MININAAKNTDFLLTRIKQNTPSGNFNFNDWIFSNFELPQEGDILELCCGTGAQTKFFAQYVTKNQNIFAVDISQKALDVTVKSCNDMGVSVVPINSGLDEFQNHIPVDKRFSICFCSYGLYYANDVDIVLNNIKDRLLPNGILVIVGPYNNNNNELFYLLRDSNVIIPDDVFSSSAVFMTKTVVPFMLDNFESVIINTARNPVKWDTANDVISYWENTTFYDNEKHINVEKSLTEHFNNSAYFINTKHIMCAVARNILAPPPPKNRINIEIFYFFFLHGKATK
ncbi:hypothetical protein AGMMS50212_02990 [Spirochaetia bacterium]|nr:hypothetical protein AGMMS50212_02990 [Spirochaetia bacterium]